MSIQGALERVSENGVSGWCVDRSNENPASVAVFAGNIPLGTVRADIPRKDIQRSLGRDFAGFRFPFSRALFRLLPDGATVSARSNGKRLPVLKGTTPTIRNGTQQDGSLLLERLRDGHIIGAKSGQLFLPLKGTALGDKTLHAFELGNEIFARLFSKHLFICYGTLLGCIREGDFIPHDDDVDVCFLAEGSTIHEATEEFRKVVEGLRNKGYTVEVQSQIQFHWRIAGVEIDVFMAWIEAGRFYSYNVAAPLARDDIYPVRPHDFNGREVPVPCNPTAVLEAIYGPGWRVPDPQFQWRPNPEARAMMRRINDMPLDHLSARQQIRRYWATFYGATRTTIPSSFAVSVAIELPEHATIIDIGCGNGRDSILFASLGHRVLGLDIVSEAIRSNQRLVRERGLTTVEFAQIDVGTPAALDRHLAALLNGDAGLRPERPQIAVYARFLLHAITIEEESVLLESLSRHLPSGARCYFEFRTEADAGTTKQFGEHYRRYIHLERFVARATASDLLSCTYSVQGRGLAKFGDEDPLIGRVYLRHR